MNLNNITFDELFTEAVEDLLARYGKYQRLIDIINDDETSPKDRIRYYQLLPKEFKNKVNIDIYGNKTGHPLDSDIMTDVETFNKYAGEGWKQRKEPNMAKLGWMYRKMPSGKKGSSVPYKSLIQEPINTYALSNYKKFAKLFRNIIDPKITTTIESDGDIYKLKSSYFRSQKDKEIAQAFGARSENLYGINKYIQNLDDKFTQAFSKIAKFGANNENEYIKTLVELINQNTEGRMSKFSIVVPYSYLLSLAFGDKEQQLALLDICTLLLRHNIFYAPKTDEEVQAYVYFNDNIEKWRTYIENGGNLRDIYTLSEEERDTKINKLEGTKASLKYSENKDTVEDVIAKEYKGVDTDTVLKAIKKVNYITDDEWNNKPEYEKINNVRKFKDYFFKHFNKNK